VSFKDLKVSAPLIKVLTTSDINKPFPIQKATLPDAISGKDILGRGQTGSGKTLAFGLALLTRLAGRNAAPIRPLALVLSPTRELAMQINDVIAPLSRSVNLNSQVVAGGLSYSKQIQALKRGVPIVVATPGRLIDLIQKKQIKLDEIEITVLDEADQMLDMGFVNDVKKIVKLTPNNRQTLLFSATMPIAIRELAEMFLKNPETVSVSPVSSTAENVEQKVYFVDKTEKRNLLYHLIKNDNLSDVLVFSRTKHGADNVVKALRKNGIAAEAIHGDKSQNARQRVLDAFKNKEVGVLVATDIAARGIDIDQLPVVINFDLPNIPETYVHRIGRTGRAGNGGIAISFCSKDEHGYWKDIQKLIKVDVETVTEHPYKWHEGAPDNAAPSNPPKNSNRSGGAHKSRKSDASKQNKKRWY